MAESSPQKEEKKRAKGVRFLVSWFVRAMFLFWLVVFYFSPFFLKAAMGTFAAGVALVIYVPEDVPYRWEVRLLLCQGWTFSQWLAVLKEERFVLHPVFWHRALFVTIMTAFNSLFWIPKEQELFPDDVVEKSQIKHTPIFVVGHFRSGTSLLHELLVKDPNHVAPTVYQCFCPFNFLSRQDYAEKQFGMLRFRRPMDSMRVGLSSPQEDEFALTNLTALSPYMSSIFPLSEQKYQKYLTFKEVNKEERAIWKHALKFFFKKCLFLNQDQRIVSKSPPHTARLAIIREVFPDAKFIHISRDPLTIFQSTVKLYNTLVIQWLLQRSPLKGDQQSDHVNNYIINFFATMYDAYFQDVKDLGLTDKDLIEIRFEDLVQHPTKSLEEIYKRFDLPDWDKAQPAIQKHEDDQKAFKMNNHNSMDPELKAKIRQRWAHYFEHFNY